MLVFSCVCVVCCYGVVYLLLLFCSEPVAELAATTFVLSRLLAGTLLLLLAPAAGCGFCFVLAAGRHFCFFRRLRRAVGDYFVLAGGQQRFCFWAPDAGCGLISCLVACSSAPEVTSR